MKAGLSKEFSGWAGLHILVGFELFILYVEHPRGCQESRA